MIVFPTIIHAQGWQWQNPLPFGDPVLDIFFVNENYGWMAPENTTLYKTTDAGIGWHIVYTDILFENLFFIDSLEGWGIGRTNIVYDYNSIYHTLDGGETWEIQLADTTVRYEIFFINKNIGWATGELSLPIDNWSYLFKTTNGGLTWNRSALRQLRRGDGGYKGVHFLDSLKGWLVGGMFYGVMTTDGGETWQRDSSLAEIERIISADKLNIWGLSDYGFIIRSTNGGETWTKHKIIDTTTEVRAGDFYAFNKDTIYVSCNLGFFRSSDGGGSFSLISTQVNNTFTFSSSLEIWAGQFSSIFHSTNGGYDWANLIQTNNEFGFEIYYDVDFVNENAGWIAGDKVPIGSGGFILKTTTGGREWQTQYFSPSAYVRKVMFFDEYTGWAVGGSGLILKTTDGGENWIIKDSGKNYSLNEILFTDTNNGWASGGDFDSGAIIKTTDGGDSWVDVSPSFNMPSSYGLFFVDSLSGWVSAGGGSGVGYLLKTTDGGINWIIQRQANGMYFDALYAKNNLEVWAGGYDPLFNKVLIYSLDGGENWLGNSSFIRGGVYDIKFTDENNGWLISFREVYNTTDSGKNWQHQKSYSTRSFSSIDFVNNKSGWIVGDYGTILHTTNGGVTFIEDSENFSSIPEGINIYQNFPNPFNPGTKIKIYLDLSIDYATLEIFNLLGRKITVLYKGTLSVGEHTFQWEGKDLSGNEVSSGIYFSVFRTADQLLVRKMLKLK